MVEIIKNIKSFKSLTLQLFYDMKEKISDVKLKFGMLEENNLILVNDLILSDKLNEAYIRLRIINFLWPNNTEGAYLLALFYIFNKKTDKSLIVLNNLENKNEYVLKLIDIIKNDEISKIYDLLKNNDLSITELKNVL